MSSEATPRLRVVVLGGCGFVGRNLVELLVSSRAASAVRVVDKTPPQTAWLSPRHARVFEDPIVEFKSANLINLASCLSSVGADAGGAWDVVVNCAGETKPGHPEAVYREGIVTLCGNVARACAQQGVGRLVQITSGLVYPNREKDCDEECDTEAWSVSGGCYLQVERQLSELSVETQLAYTVLRPAVCYGPADTRSLMPRLLVGAVYKALDEPMRLLWSAGLRLSTVHVRDLCRAALHVATRPDAVGRTYNVADEARSTQGSVTQLIAELYGIKYEFLGSVLSMLAKSDLSGVAEEANDKHLVGWARACAAGGVANTPLEPSTSGESLRPHHVALDAGRLRESGFRCEVPAPTGPLLREIMEEYVEMKVFPKTLLP